MAKNAKYESIMDGLSLDPPEIIQQVQKSANRTEAEDYSTPKVENPVDPVLSASESIPEAATPVIEKASATKDSLVVNGVRLYANIEKRETKNVRKSILLTQTISDKLDMITQVTGVSTNQIIYDILSAALKDIN